MVLLAGTSTPVVEELALAVLGELTGTSYAPHPLLTAVPLSPAGLGIVEAGVIGVLHVAYGVPLPEATAIALLDRVISVFSVIVLGSIAYVVSPKPRGEGRIPQPDQIEPTALTAPA